MEIRAANINNIDNSHFDVVIVGAGINGASTFRELALNGVSVLLVEKHDFCSGASAAPSRLIHGGIKYLENGEFRLVAESTHERNRLLRNAAHLVKPLPCTIPFYSWFGGVFSSALKFLRIPGGRFKNRGIVIVKIGLMIYDWLGRKHRVMPNHHITGGAESHRQFPGLDPAVKATATYYDALITQPERLCLELITDTLRDTGHDCVALNHVSVVGCSNQQLMLKDSISDRELAVRTDLIVNAAGPWIDKVNHSLGVNSHYIGGSKGSHLILDHAELQRSLNGHMIYFETGDNRLCLAYAIGDRVLIGTTDIRIDDPDTAECEEEEVDYLFAVMAELLPGIVIERSHIVYRYTGVRPLPFSAGVGIGSVSRDHSIEIDEASAKRPFVIASLVGGKWTTFRAFGEETADLVLQRLQKSRTRHTHDLAIGGGLEFPVDSNESAMSREMADQYRLSPAIVERLLERYGRNHAMFTEVAASTEAQQTLTSMATYLIGEIQYICRQEMVMRLEDLVFRRTTLALEGRATDALLTEVADIAAPILGWDEEQVHREIQGCNARLRPG